MASVFPLSDYDTVGVALAGTATTDCLTVPAGWRYDVTSITLTQSAGAVGGADQRATVIFFESAANVDYTIVREAAVPATEFYSVEGMPVHLNEGDKIKVAGESGMHVTISYTQYSRGGRA